MEIDTTEVSLEKFIDDRAVYFGIRTYRAIKRGIKFGMLQRMSVPEFACELWKPNGWLIRRLWGCGEKAIADLRISVYWPPADTVVMPKTQKAERVISERNQGILKQAEDGASNRDIALCYGISYARVQQVIKKYRPDLSRRQVRADRICVVCRALFHPSHKRIRHCSHKCAGISHRSPYSLTRYDQGVNNGA